MPIVQKFSTASSIELGEFLEYADKAVDVNTRDGILALGETFAMLGNNRTFLSQFFAQVIKDTAPRDPLSFLLSQSVVIARYEGFYLRANFWLPDDQITRAESVLYAYDQPHDHNFDLLSCAYCGDGYVSDGFLYDYDKVVGYTGEEVPLEPLGPHRHECGDILLYECSRDIHIQHPPATPSITLNVLPLGNQNGLIDQYFFSIPSADSTVGVIQKHAPNIIEQRRHMFDVAKYVANDEIADTLAEIAKAHVCKRTRYEALRALRGCNRALHDDVALAMRDDPAPIVQHYVRSVLTD